MESNISNEFDVITDVLDSIIDIMHQSTKDVIDLGNVNYELNSIIDKLDLIIDKIDDQQGKEMLESAKFDITFATLDIKDNVNIFDKIAKLKDAKIKIMNVNAKQ